MRELLNWDLLRNPLNWAVVLLMLLIVSFAIDALARRVVASSSAA